MLNPSFWSNRRVFVTGATGFLGQWMVARLRGFGAEVVSLVRDVPVDMPSGPEETTGGSELRVIGQLEDQPFLERVINEHEIETVLHLGAQAIVGTGNRSPLSTFEANIRGTYNLLESCRRVSTVKRIVVASSDKAYGSQPTLPYHEDMPLQGHHPYDVSKSCTDLLAQTYHQTYDLPVCITRCGNFFGGGDTNYNRIIPGTILSVLRHERPIIRSDGKFIRDYIYVRDVVDAYLLLAERMDEKSLHGEAFNFGLEKPISVIDLTNEILELMDATELEPEILNQASNEIREQWLSSDKARQRLNWKPEFGLTEGLRETIAWYQKTQTTS